MNNLLPRLAQILSTGQPYAVRDLCQRLAVDIGMLNLLRAKLPEYMKVHLKQGDDFWQLRQSFVYMLKEDLADLIQEEGISLDILDFCTSTNTILMERLRQNPDVLQPCVLLSYEQTAGRGRMDREWKSAAGQSLTFSLSWFSQKTQIQLSALPLLIALSCQQVLERLNIAIQIKWPNDLLLNNAKVGGILCESFAYQQGTWCVIGIGLNFSLPQMAAAQNVGAIWQVAPDVCPEMVFKQLIHQIYHNLTVFSQQGFSAFQVAYSAVHREHEQKVQLLHHERLLAEGKVVGVDDNGALLLENQGKTMPYVCGDISLRYALAKKEEPVAPKILLLDCGNSQVKWALSIDGELVETARAPYARLSSLQAFHQKHPDISRIYGSAVCGDMKKRQVERNLAKPVSWLASERFACGIHNHYRHPAEHGADRWFNALGVRRFSQNSCVVVSCGTAITIDVLTDSNQYLGGSIMPGFNLMKEALADKTAHLDRPFGRPYPFSTTTSNALASGILDASVGAILLMYERVKKREDGKNPDIILTGGGAGRILKHLSQQLILDTHIEIVDNLVIFGLLNWIEHR